MDALDFLESQHKEAERLFDEIARVEESQKYVLFETLSDILAVHAAIEERIFYPSVKRKETEHLLKHSAQEHLQVKRELADLMDDEPGVDSDFAVKMQRMKDDLMHHVNEERTELFPLVRKFFDAKMLQTMGRQLEELSNRLLAQENPSETVPEETGAPAQF